MTGLLRAPWRGGRRRGETWLRLGVVPALSRCWRMDVLQNGRHGKPGLQVVKDLTVPVTLRAPILSHTFNKCLLFLLFLQAADKGGFWIPPRRPSQFTPEGNRRGRGSGCSLAAGAARTPGLPAGSSSRLLISPELPNRARIKCCFQSSRELGVSSVLCKIGRKKTERGKSPGPGNQLAARGTRLRTRRWGGGKAGCSAERGAGKRRRPRHRRLPFPAGERPPPSSGAVPLALQPLRPATRPAPPAAQLNQRGPRGSMRRPAGRWPRLPTEREAALGIWLLATRWVASGRLPPVFGPQFFSSKKRKLDSVSPRCLPLGEVSALTCLLRI